MMNSSKVLMAVVCVTLACSPCIGAEKGVIEGVVRDRNGVPMICIVFALSGPYTATDTLFVPFGTKSSIGAVVATFPPSTRYRHSGWSFVGKKGHYRIRVPAESYFMRVDFQKGYEFDPGVQVKSGETVMHDITLSCIQVKSGRKTVCLDKP